MRHVIEGMYTRMALLAGMAAALAFGGYRVGQARSVQVSTHESDHPVRVAVVRPSQETETTAPVKLAPVLSPQQVSEIVARAKSQVFASHGSPAQQSKEKVQNAVLRPGSVPPNSGWEHPYLQRNTVPVIGMRHEGVKPVPTAKWWQAVEKTAETDIDNVVTQDAADLLTEHDYAVFRSQLSQSQAAPKQESVPSGLESRVVSDPTVQTPAAADYGAINQVATAQGTYLYRVSGVTQRQPKYSVEFLNWNDTIDASEGFALMVALKHRYDLGLSSRQVTKLQFLQADFIRKFAPLREAYENEAQKSRLTYQITSSLQAQPSIRIVEAKGGVQITTVPITVTTSANTLTADHIVVNAKPQDPTSTYIATQVQPSTSKTAIVTWDASPKTYTVFLQSDNKNQGLRIVPSVSGYALAASSKEGALIAERVRKLKQEFTEKAMSVLTADQQKRLKNLVDQSRTSTRD